MNQILTAILFGAVIFIAVIIISRMFGGKKDRHTEEALNRIYEEQERFEDQLENESLSILKSDSSLSANFLLSLPKGRQMYELIMKAGMEHRLPVFLIGVPAAFLFITIYFLPVFGLFYALLIALLIAFFIPRFLLKRNIAKRNEKFINMFPDAVDMIVRSVKSGHPLNTALRMIAENMDPPISTEFKTLVDEIAFGRPTTEALLRMSKRIDEPDLQFFVVILSVQQETGGNLAEVLSNLSGIIRKRKQLRLRIKAMTSEGRATALILGSLPLFVFGAIHLTSPEYLLPLFNTQPGNIILATSAGLVGLAGFIVHNMLQIDI